MAELTTAGYNPINTQMLADAIVPPATQSPTTFIAQDIRKKELEPDFSKNPFTETSLFGTSFKEEPRALRGYANEYYDEANTQLSNGEYIPRYENFIPGTNNEERLAQKQTTTEKWVNGFEKLIGKTGVAVLGGTLGVADSLVEGISKGSLSEAYNTGFNNWLDDLNVKLDYKLPNYYTEQEKGASLFGQTAQANFWADKVFGGLSFTAGALISEGIWTAATGGVGLLSAESQLGRLAKWTIKGVGGEEKAIQALNIAKQTAKGSSTALLEATAQNSKSLAKEIGVGENLFTTIAEGTKDASINAYKIRKIGDIALVATRSAGYEAGMEARQYMNSTEHSWLENYQKVNGHEPSADEYSQFKDGLTTSANYVFGANMIIVGGSNLVQFGNALLGKTTNPLVGNNFLKRSLLGVGFDKEISAEGKVLYKALEATRGQKIAGKVWGVLGAALPEAQEEMGQRVVSQTAENYMMNAYDPKHTKTTYGVADAFTSALNDTYGTQAGWSEGLVGAIVGVLGAGAHSKFKFGEVSQEIEESQKAVEYANAFTADTHLTNVMTNNQILASQENKKVAQQRGDLVGEVLADTSSAISYLDRANSIGDRHEAVADFTRQINAVSNEDLAKQLNLGTGEEAEKQAEQFKEQKIVELKNLSEQHTKNINYATALLGETEIAGLDKTSTRKVVAAMAYSMTMGETAMKANQDLVSHVKNIVADSVDVQGVTDALDVQQVLDLAPREKTLKLSQLNLQLFNLNKQEKETLNRQLEVSKVSESSLATPEDSKARQNALIDINQELVKLEEEKQKVAEQKQLVVDAIGVKNFTDGTVTVDMFDNQNENLDKLRETLKSIQLQNPEKYFEIQKALQAQAKAVQHIKNYQKTTQALVNPNTRVKVLNGWITKLLNKNTKLNESTAAYFTDIIKNWSDETKRVFQESDQNKNRKAWKNREAVDPEYLTNLGEQAVQGMQLNSVDQEIYDTYKKEIEDNAKATIKTPTNDDKIKKLEKERDTKIADIENKKLTEKAGINSVFEQIPELASIGTSEQYNEYTSNIFPNSKVQDVVYHGTMSKSFEEFNTEVIFFTDDQEYAKNLNIGIKQFGKVLPVLIDTTNPLNTEQEISYIDENNKTLGYLDPRNIKKQNTYDAVIGKDQGQSQGITYVVFNDSQTHILGSNKDIEDFKNFVEGKTIQQDIKTEIEKIKNEYAKKINELKPKVEINTLQDLKNKVKEIITSSDYLTQYFGADLAEQNKTKPSKAEVDEYTELLTKIDRKVEPNTDRIVSRPTGFYKNIGLTNEETDRLKELQIKLNDWVTLEGTVTNDSQSVAEMLDLIGALQTQAVKETVKTDLEDKDYKSVVDAVDEQASSMGSSVRGLQTPTNALATKSKTNIRFSHIGVKTLASFFPNSSLIVNPNKSFEIDLNNGQILAGKINEKGGQDIPLKDWNKLASQSNVLIKNFGTNSSAISQFLGLDSQGKELYQNVPSDFDYQQTDGTNLNIDQVAVNQVKNGDTLDLFVSSTDSYNASLSNKDLPKLIHIYVMNNGKLLGSLPASYDKEEVDGIGLPLMDLRASASEFVKGKEGLIKLPQKMTAQITFIGAPQIALQKSGEEVVTKNNPFTKEMLQNVVGQGFIENGQITSIIKTDVNQFINKISNSNRDAKIPFVAFNYNSKVVAFPISLNSVTVDKSEAVLEVFNSAEATTAVKAKTLVDALIANGLEASSYGIDFTDKEGWIDSQETENALNDLSKIKEFVDLERFATKNYNKESLINDGTIAIDLANTPFETSKIMLGMSNKIDSDVLGYREFLAENEEKERQLRTDLNNAAKEIYSQYINNEDLDNTFTQTFDETPIIKGDVSDVIMRKNINTLKTAIKGASQKTKKVIGADLFKRANDLIKELNYSAKKSKDVKQQIKDSEYYQDIDTTFVTVDNEGNLENPYINETEAIQEIGGIKTEEEFNEALESSDLDYLKTSKAPLFEDMSQFNNIPVKEIIGGELVDKLNTEVKDTLEATLREPENNALVVSLANLEGYSESVWNSSPEAVKTLLKEVEKQALEINVDLRGMSEEYYTKTQEEILNVTRALDAMILNSTEATLENFINVYQDFTNVVQEVERAVVKVNERYRELPLVKLETTDSEYKTFKEQGLLKIQDGVYIKTDGNEKSLAEVENLSATNVEVFPAGTIQGDVKNLELVKEDLNTYVESQMTDILTNDVEYDVDVVKKLIYYKTYFGTQGVKTAEKSFEQKLSQIAISDIKNRNYLVSDFIADIRNKQLKGENAVLDNLIFNDKGITLKSTDIISVNDMNDYLKEDEDLRNYFLLNKFTNFDVKGVAQDEIVSERDMMVNGATKENFKGDYRTINSETIQTKSEQDFITVDGINYERSESDFYAKLPKNETGFLEINVEKSTLNIDTANYTTVQSEAKIESSNKYSAEESKKLDSELGCE